MGRRHVARFVLGLHEAWTSGKPNAVAQGVQAMAVVRRPEEAYNSARVVIKRTALRARSVAALGAATYRWQTQGFACPESRLVGATGAIWLARRIREVRDPVELSPPAAVFTSEVGLPSHWSTTLLLLADQPRNDDSVAPAEETHDVTQRS